MKNDDTQKDKVTLEDIVILIGKTEEKINKNIEDLAIMTAKGFSELKSEVNGKFEEVDHEFKKMNQKLDGMSNRIDDATVGKVSIQQHESLAMRVGKIEEKLV